MRAARGVRLDAPRTAAALYAALADVPDAEPRNPAWPERRRGGDAARHLFRVATGLDSRLLGEPHILGQVRVAGDRDAHYGPRGTRLAALFRAAAEAAHLARAGSGLGRLAVSCVDAALRRLPAGSSADAPTRVAILGGGTLAVEFASRLAPDAAFRVDVLARHPEAAARALPTAVTPGPLHSLAARSEAFDAIIAATSAPAFVLSAAHLAGRTRPLTLLDLGSPANIDPDVRAVPGVTLATLEELSESPADIAAAAARARAMVDLAAARWHNSKTPPASSRPAPALRGTASHAPLLRSAVV